MSTIQRHKVPSWDYTAVRGRERIRGTMVAASPGDVSKALSVDGLVALKIDEHKEEFDLRQRLAELQGNGPKLDARQQADLATELKQMVSSGMGSADAIDILAEAEESTVIAEMLHTIANDVRGGQPLHLAFSGYPRAFDGVFLSYLQAGADAGTPVESLTDLAELLNRRAALNSKVKGVISYPRLMFIFTIVVAGLVIKFLLPRFETLFDQFDADLPLPTQILLSVSHNFFQVIGVGLMVFLAIRMFIKSKSDDPAFAERLDRIKFKLPGLGPMMHKLTLFRWASTLGGSLASGVRVIQAVELAADASGSRWMKNVSAEIVEAIESGRPLTGPLGDHPDLIPLKIRRMILTGEETGNVEDMLKHVAITLQQDLDTDAEQIAARLNVFLIAGMASVVGSIVIALYLPIALLAVTVAEGLGQ